MGAALPTFDSIRSNGFLYSVAIAFNRLVPVAWFRCRAFVVYQMGVIPEAAPRRGGTIDDLSIRVRRCVTPIDHQEVEDLTHFSRPGSTGGLLACRAEVDGVLAGGYWSAKSHFDELALGVRLAFAPHQAWLFAALVRKEYRRMGIHTRMLRFLVAELMQQGTEEVFVAVNPTNVGSNRVHARYARQVVGRVFAARLFGVAVCFTRGGVRSDRWWTWDANRRPIELRCIGAE